MKYECVYRLYLNDYLFIHIFYNGSAVYIEDYGNCPFGIVNIANTDEVSIISFNSIPAAVVDLKTGKMKTKLTILPTVEIRNYSEHKKNNFMDHDYKSNHDAFKSFAGNGIQNETELHTHFMEVLSGEEFLKTIFRFDKYLKKIGINKFGKLCDSYSRSKTNPKVLEKDPDVSWYDIKTIISEPTIYSTFVSDLSIPVDKQVPFEEITKALHRRNALIDLLAYEMSYDEIKELIYDNIGELDAAIRELCKRAKQKIYAAILIMSLKTLQRQKIKYVELSYSNSKTIEFMFDSMKEYPVDGIECGFLLSENRNCTAKTFRHQARELERLIDEGYAKGFDLMGEETEIFASDYKKEEKESLYNKLEQVLLILNRYHDNNLVCRLHAGEIAFLNSYDSKSNPERSLEIIEMIASDNGITIPPPSIRIGHGLHFVPTENYLRLLRQFHVTVEINASSNFAISNIKDLSKIPYKWYLDNNIPVVLGTDGGGFYLTTPLNESYIAEVFAGHDAASKIHDYDRAELERRDI